MPKADQGGQKADRRAAVLDIHVRAIGKNLPAVDATAARIMGLVPERISYLQLAANRLGPVAEHRITQRGERWQELVSPFQVLDRPALRRLRATPDGPLVS